MSESATSDRERSPAFDTATDFAFLLNALPHPVLMVGAGNRIDYANSAAENFFQVSSSLLCRQTLDEIATFASPLLALVDQVRRDASAVNEYGVDLGSPKIGTHQLVDIYAGRVPEKPGSILIMLQQRTMAQMIERQLTHRGAARTVSGMAAVLAHEIKNPLSGIRGAAQLLEDGLSDSDRALTQLICAESDRVCKLVDRMEVFGDERPMTRESVNIHDVLNHVKNIALNGFAKHIKITESYDPSLPAVPGNRDKLIQAFLNLIKNAAEAIGEERGDGRILLTTAFRPGVRLSLPGSTARVGLPLLISVQDNGPGVPEDLRQNLFDPFVTTKQNGTGLGLAMVAKIIGDHGGIIECDSETRSTSFRALMPMQNIGGSPQPTGKASVNE